MLTLNRMAIAPPELKNLESTQIAPVNLTAHRPIWSVMIPTYNRTKYLEKTLKSVLAQDIGPDKMQIEVIDNCSTDVDTAAFVRRIGQDRISFYKQQTNVGLTANMTACIQRSRGHLVHILHDDDAVMPGFYSQLQQAFEREPSIGAAFCRCVHDYEEYHREFLDPIERNTPGILTNWLERIAVANRIQVPSMVVKRSVYEQLGGYHPELCQNIDWEMWKRISAHYPVWYEPQALAYYRVHASSNTSQLIRSGKNIADQRRAIEICHKYWPHQSADDLSRKAREACALYALDFARRALIRGDIMASNNQIREALKSSFSLKVIGTLALLPARVAISDVKRLLIKGSERQQQQLGQLEVVTPGA